MTGIDWSKYPVIPGYDPVQSKREAHARIRRETEGMTREEVREYFRKGSKEFREQHSRLRSESSPTTACRSTHLEF